MRKKLLQIGLNSGIGLIGSAAVGYPLMKRQKQIQKSQNKFKKWLKKGKPLKKKLSYRDENLEFLTIESPIDQLPLSVRVYKTKHPKGLVQIVHGCQEYKKNYYELAHYLQKAGYACILASQRGHGDSINRQNPRGHISDLPSCVADQIAVTHYLQELYPDEKLPLALIGHSFGSLIFREYLKTQSQNVQKVILLGTVQPYDLAGLASQIAKIVTLYTGARNTELLLANYAALLPYHSRKKWISNNPAFLEDTLLDPKTVRDYTKQGLLTILEADQALTQLATPDEINQRNHTVQILSLTGEYDRVTGGPSGLRKTKKALIAQGFSLFEAVELSGMVHDILHDEDSKERVYPAILKFLAK